MSPIWFCLALSMILGLCGSALLKEDSFSDSQITDEITDIDEELEIPQIGNNSPKILDEFGHAHGKKKRTKKTRKCSNVNKPRQDTQCYYPYRSSTPLYCYYSVLFGNRTDGDEKVWSKTYRKPEIESEETPYTFEVIFPKPDAKNDGSINFIMVQDADDDRNNRIFDDNIVITSGGIGKKYFKLQVTTEDLDIRRYQFIIYALPDHQ